VRRRSSEWERSALLSAPWRAWASTDAGAPAPKGRMRRGALLRPVSRQVPARRLGWRCFRALAAAGLRPTQWGVQGLLHNVRHRGGVQCRLPASVAWALLLQLLGLGLVRELARRPQGVSAINGLGISIAIEAMW
jgi:hypothetical protein